MVTKSSIMLGCGENDQQVLQTLRGEKNYTPPVTKYQKLYAIFFSFCRSEEFRGRLCYTGPVHSTNQMASQSEGICATREVQVLGGDREPVRLCLHGQWTSCPIVLQGWRVFHQEHSQGKKRESRGYCLTNILIVKYHSQIFVIPLYCSVLFNAHTCTKRVVTEIYRNAQIRVLFEMVSVFH